MTLERERARRRYSSQTGESGMSLVELVVGILVFGIVTTLIANLYISTVQVVSVSSSLDTNTRMASNGMNEMTRVVRAGTPYPVAGAIEPKPTFVAADGTSLTMYAYVNLANSDQTPVRVRFSVVDDNLMETTWAAAGPVNGFYSFPAWEAPTATRELAASVVPQAEALSDGGARQPLFTYSDVNGAAITVPPGGVTDEETLRSIASVTITLTIQGSTTDERARVTLVNTVGIPNLGQNRTLP
ncbi:hypothetical protein ELQ92_05905 [Labedella populi]|uniref:Uncharacterized protein n=1 Tax=Labedella populi TaxID=2498850 RepID=A0A444QC69_9MICO|nr:hypothetical protein [Labedella populi]RWZ64299.1 hypothetical protein ELQ92_05905 [Labedella populi]